MTDRKTVLAVVYLLGAFLLLSLGGVIYLVAIEQQADRIALVATPMGTALGALAAILVSTRSTNDQPMAVNVVNPPAKPVPVDAAP